MKIVTKKQLKELMKQYPEGGIVFAEYTPDVCGEIQVTDRGFGATVVVPFHGEVFDYDWNILEYRDNDLFVVYDNNDVLQMIQTLVRGLKIELEDEYLETYL